MMTSLYNGVSGIKTNSYGIDVTANNISNVNTVGFIGSTPEFKSIFYNRLNMTARNPVTSQIGVGSTTMATSLNMHRQGSLQATDGAFDMAIKGEGFFGVRGKNGKFFYTRNGYFIKDKNGDIVDKNGYYLQGSMIPFSSATYSQSALRRLNSTDSSAQTFNLKDRPRLTDGAQDKIHLPSNLYLPTEPTTKVSFRGTLSADIKKEFIEAPLESNSIAKDLDKTNKLLNLSGDIKDSPAVLSYKAGDEVEATIADKDGKKIKARGIIGADGKFKLSNLDVRELNLDGELSVQAIARVKQEVPQTASFSSDVYAANNDKNTLKLEFTRVIGTTTWKVKASVISADGKTILSQKEGELKFNEKGALVSNTLGSIDNAGTQVGINLGSIYKGTDSTAGFEGVVMGAGKSKSHRVERDGYAEGILKTYTMNDQGEIVATFDNGRAFSVAKVALYHFQNDQGLASAGSNLFEATANSGEAFFYKNARGEVFYNSKIASSMLEMSNVDLATELTSLIVMQKAYDASAKSITTSNDILQVLIGLKK